MVLLRAGLAEVGLDHETVAGGVLLARLEAADDLHRTIVAPAQLHGTRLEDISVAHEDGRPVTHSLDGVERDADGNRDVLLQDIARYEDAWAPAPLGVRQHDAGRGAPGLLAHEGADVGDSSVRFESEGPGPD